MDLLFSPNAMVADVDELTSGIELTGEGYEYEYRRVEDELMRMNCLFE